jgi:hypothetical protein
MGKTKYLSAFERDMMVDAHRFVSRTETLLVSVCIKNVPPRKGHPDNFTQLWNTFNTL